jgi:hypothetical protein
MRIVYLPVDCDVNSLDQKLSVPTLDQQAIVDESAKPTAERPVTERGHEFVGG